MRPPPDADIYAPEFPPRLDWVNVAFLRMDKLIGSHAILIEFWDFARINSIRTIPYLRAWHERYREHGLRVIGVHSPGYQFGRDAGTVRRAVERLDVDYAVVLDPAFEIWRLYGNRGWPGRYLFDRRSRLRYLHYGEGDYDDSERAIQECLREIDADFEPPDPLAPLRPEDVPGVELEPQTADIALPGDRARIELVRDWVEGSDYLEAADAGAAAAARYRAGSAYAVLSGGGVEEPGLYETDGTVVAEHPGMRLHGFQFTPLAPSGSRPSQLPDES